MGKFSEALKKAGKEDRQRRLEKTEEPLPLKKTNALPKQTKASNPSMKKSYSDEAAPLQERMSPQGESPLMVETREESLHPAPAVPGSDAESGTMDIQDVAVTTKQPHHRQEHETPNVVVVKPSTLGENEPVVETALSQDHSKPSEEPVKGVKATSGPDIQIHYSRTKVQTVDPEKLKNNRIFSIFDEIETTDQINILRTQVLKRLKEIGGNTILVTSANPYEGKTFTSINLGVSIAKEFSRTVLIIDADLRKPTKHHTSFSTEFFTLDVEVGLTDYLKGEADIPDILINPGISRLTLIPSGEPVTNAPELLSSIRMEKMMSDIKSRYASDRLVIVDGPAMLPFPDTLILSRYVDGVLPVVELERTPVKQLKKMMDGLKDTLIIGTVLNKNKG
jgi:non-specific protein-tyrosine kinase